MKQLKLIARFIWLDCAVWSDRTAFWKQHRLTLKLGLSIAKCVNYKFPVHFASLWSFADLNRKLIIIFEFFNCLLRVPCYCLLICTIEQLNFCKFFNLSLLLKQFALFDMSRALASGTISNWLQPNSTLPILVADFSVMNFWVWKFKIISVR